MENSIHTDRRSVQDFKICSFCSFVQTEKTRITHTFCLLYFKLQHCPLHIRVGAVAVVVVNSFQLFFASNSTKKKNFSILYYTLFECINKCNNENGMEKLKSNQIRSVKWNEKYNFVYTGLTQCCCPVWISCVRIVYEVDKKLLLNFK